MKITNLFRILTILVSITFFTSCESEADIKYDIDKLRAERIALSNGNEKLKLTKIVREREISKLNEKINELGIYVSGKAPQYILKLRLKQSHISLDPFKHAKDAMNAIEFEMPVSKEFYESVSEGTNIVDDFRMGSLLLEGSFGDWEMTVEGKEIRK